MIRLSYWVRAKYPFFYRLANKLTVYLGFAHHLRHSMARDASRPPHLLVCGHELPTLRFHESGTRYRVHQRCRGKQVEAPLHRRVLRDHRFPGPRVPIGPMVTAPRTPRGKYDSGRTRSLNIYNRICGHWNLRPHPIIYLRHGQIPKTAQYLPPPLHRGLRALRCLYLLAISTPRNAYVPNLPPRALTEY